ncbi:MAG TPA: hypothetical protein VHU61_08275 [Solirubrobacteraceae bacterium]|nr:hypothetical protein [Solirubrobacteraceae bacterium]
MSENPHIYPGDVQRDAPIERRPEEEIERELRVSHLDDGAPGGAEGGDASPSADVPPGTPADDQAPTGDTDQHSDDDSV